MPKIKRSELQNFLDTTPAATAPTWSLLGEGITTGTINYNPEVETETYIHEDSATTTVERYAPTFPLEAKAISSNAAFEFLDDLRRTRAVGSAAETEMLIVSLWETPTSTDKYPAELQPVSISFESLGGDGGTTLSWACTINFRGDATLGLYDVSSNSFTANP